MAESIYSDKIQTLEKVFGEQQIDQGGHWKKQPLPPNIHWFARALENRFGPRPRIIDTGSGTGEHTLQLAADHGFRATGLEITSNGVRSARLLAYRERLIGNGVEFVQGNMLAQPFRKGTFEGFHTFCALCHLHRKDWPKYFQQMVEITVPGALGVTTEFCGEDDEFYGVPIREANIGWLEFRNGFVNLETRKGEELSRLHNYPNKYETFNWWFGTVEDLEQASRSYFRVVDAYHWDHPEPKPGQAGKIGRASCRERV